MTAAVLTTSAFIPQTLRAMPTRPIDDRAWAFLALFGLGIGLGIGLWLAYGMVERDPALITANGLTLVTVAVISAAKASYRLHR